MHLNNSRYFVGIDGGGTNTRAVIGTEQDGIIATVSGPGSNIKATPAEQVRQQMIFMLNQLFEKAKVTKAAVVTVFISTAGGDREEDNARWRNWMEEYFNSQTCQIYVTNDAVAAIVSGTYQTNGLVLIAGTGSIAYLVMENGQKIFRAGGWGYLFGDEGSGYYIGTEALRYITKTYDQNHERRDDFTEALLSELKITHPVELVTKIYENSLPRVAIASVASKVMSLAEAGNHVAVAIVEKSIKHLLELLQAIFEREQEAKKLPLVVCGGLFENKYFRNQFIHAMKAESYKNELVLPSVPPVIGAFVSALIVNSITITEEMKEVVFQSWRNIDFQ